MKSAAPNTEIASTPRPHPASSAPLTVSSVGNDERARWDAFVTSESVGSLYHLYDWTRINESVLRHESHYLAAQEHGEIVGVLPLVLIRSRLFGRILCSMPFVNFGGPIAKSPRIANALLEHAVTLAGESKSDYLELRCASPIEGDLPVSKRKVSMTLALNADPEALYASFTRKHRKNIRSAQRGGFEVRSGGTDILPDFYRVLEESWRGLGTPLYGMSYFRQVVETFPSRTTVFVCYQHGEPVAVALTGHSNRTVEGLWAGTRPRLRHLNANYVLYWEMIRHACIAGHERFHLGRSTADSGSEQFKGKWNAEAQQLYWYYWRPNQRTLPELNVDNPKFRLAIAAWRRLPLWATRILGPPIARSIP